MDDLTEGIQPFSIVLPDYHKSDDGKRALRQAGTYDLLMETSTAPTLKDTEALRTSKAILPTDYLDSRAHLHATMIVWTTLVGPNHPFTTALGRFVQGYVNREHSLRNRLAALHEPCAAPTTLLLRFVQLRIVNYWRAAMAYGRLPDSAPNFSEVLDKITFCDGSWIPTMPKKYMARPAPTIPEMVASIVSELSSFSSSGTGSTGSEGSSSKGGGGSTSKTVTNPSPHPEYIAFKAKAGTVRVVDAIKKAGDLPTFDLDGEKVPLCVSFHLRGKCAKDCPRSKDHRAHEDEEKKTVVAWCTKAYA